MTRLLTGWALLAFAAFAVAQAPVEEVPALAGAIPTVTVPPVTVPVAPQSLPGGLDVSRPLQPVVAEPLPPVPTSPAEASYSRIMPDYHGWRSLEYVMSWTPGVSLPPLATARFGGPPVLGDPSTVTLLGGKRESRGEFEGMRLAFGRWSGADRLSGYEIGFHFLGSKTDTAVVGGGGVGGEALLGRPLINAGTGMEDYVPIAHPLMLGELAVSQTLRVQGWEVTGLRQLYSNPFVRLSALAGYRYFMANDGLRLDQRSEFLGRTADGTVRYRSAAADQIDAHNRFHGGTLGLRTQVEYAGFFAQVDTKVSLGRATEVVKISGQTVGTADSAAGTTISYFPGAVFGQASNFGRSSRGVFAVLPEANVRLGYEFAGRSRVFVGYQFTYLSEAVRAADQLDRTVALAADAYPAALLPPPTRPRLPFVSTDFWVHGVTLGLEWRY